MKLFSYIFTASLFFSSFSFAQQCLYKVHTEKFRKQSNPFKKTTNTTELVPTVIHVLQNENGSGGIGNEDISRGISQLNELFAPIDLRFVVTEIRRFNTAVYSDISYSDERFTLPLDIPLEPNQLNIYVSCSISNNGSSLGGYSYSNGSIDHIGIRAKSFDNGTTLSHEVGHHYSLAHTHNIDNNVLELVDGSNCQTAGDYICDTPADPYLNSSNFNNDANPCTYFGTELDPNGDAYNPLTNNIMSSADHECRSSFTTEQYAVMEAYKNSYRNYYHHTGAVGTLASPTMWQYFPNLGNISLEATATALGGATVDHVAFYVNGILIGSDNTSPYTYEHNFSSIGLYSVTVKTVDHLGNEHQAANTTFYVGTNRFSTKVSTGYDDAEETISSGDISRSSSDLDIGNNKGDQTAAGIKFNTISIPKEATILGAYLQFTVASYPDGNPVVCTIYGEKSTNPLSYSSSDYNITSRQHTSTFSEWTPNNWGYESWYPQGDALDSERSPNIKSIIEEIITQPDWHTNNSMAFIIYGSGAGQREAASYNAGSFDAPELIIHYTTENSLPNRQNATPQQIYISENSVNETIQINGLDSTVTLNIHSISGKLVKQISNYQGSDIDTSDLTSGFYLIVISFKNHTSSKIFIKK